MVTGQNRREGGRRDSREEGEGREGGKGREERRERSRKGERYAAERQGVKCVV